MRIVIKLTVLVMVGASVILAAQVQPGASATEQQLLASVNQARRTQGLPDLKWMKRWQLRRGDMPA